MDRERITRRTFGNQNPNTPSKLDDNMKREVDKEVDREVSKKIENVVTAEGHWFALIFAIGASLTLLFNFLWERYAAARNVTINPFVYFVVSFVVFYVTTFIADIIVRYIRHRILPELLD